MNRFQIFVGLVAVGSILVGLASVGAGYALATAALP